MLRCCSQKYNSTEQPFCECYADSSMNPDCKCGEFSADFTEWEWDSNNTDSSAVVISSDRRQVTFHPIFSTGTAMVKGNSALALNYHYYWEVKMLTQPYGTDILIGIGTDKVDATECRYSFIPLLGQTGHSYGLSYTGAIRHKRRAIRDGPGFSKGTVIGVKVDLWDGTLEYFLNRKSRGVSFYNLRRHGSLSLFPMISSTATRSSMRLIYAGSWQASLLVDAAKILGASVKGDLPIPPGFKRTLKNNFWMLLPNESCIADERRKDALAAAETKKIAQLKRNDPFLISGTERKPRCKETTKRKHRYCDVVVRFYYE